MTPPRFSVVVPVHDPPAAVLEAAIDSVRRQSFEDWELCLVDDGSTSPDVVLALDRAASDRIRVHHRSEQGGIVAATNDALDMAGGDFVAFLDHDDELHPRALEWVADVLTADDTVDYVYTDEDKIDEDGRHRDPFFKPDWSLERMRGQMYAAHLSVVRRRLVEEVGGMRPGFDGSQDYDLILRVSERARRIVHIPEVLYHWRAVAGSTADDAAAKDYAYEAGRRAIADHLERTAFQGDVELHPELRGVYRIRPKLQDEPLVSIVIPTAGGVRRVHGSSLDLVVNCVDSIVDRSTYQNYEIVCVIDDHAPAHVGPELSRLAGDRIRLVPFDAPFNFSAKINAGALESRGEFLLLLNDDTEVVTPDWMEAMLAFGLQDDVGAVGARLDFPDGRIQHAGVVCSSGGPFHSYYEFGGGTLGYFSVLEVPADYLAVTAACLLTSREAFDEVGGFSIDFPLNFNDVDFCFKVHRSGRRIVCTPEARLQHFETSSREALVTGEEIGLLQARWAGYLWHDPYYNPNLFQGGGDFVQRGYLSDGTLVPSERDELLLRS